MLLYLCLYTVLERVILHRNRTAAWAFRLSFWFIIPDQPLHRKAVLFRRHRLLPGPWYLLLYVSALLHIAAAAILLRYTGMRSANTVWRRCLRSFCSPPSASPRRPGNPAVLTTGSTLSLIVSADMDEEQRSRMAERIQTMLSAPIVIEGKLLSVGVSCGCACYPEDGDASQVRITADSRMYTEKQHHHEDDRTEEQS